MTLAAVVLGIDVHLSFPKIRATVQPAPVRRARPHLVPAELASGAARTAA
jgi:hypothetical protein